MDGNGVNRLPKYPLEPQGRDLVTGTTQGGTTSGAFDTTLTVSRVMLTRLQTSHTPMESTRSYEDSGYREEIRQASGGLRI